MTIPAKLQTYLACGTPVLAAAGGESAAIVNGNGCGIAVPPQVEKLVAAALELRDKSPEQRRAMAEASRNCYEANFTMNNLVDRLEAMMEEA